MQVSKRPHRGLRIPVSTDGQDGAVAVVAAITLTVLVLMAALVIDLGFLRADRVQSKSISDMAAAAAVVDYDNEVAGSALAACEEAVAFAEANLDAAAVAIDSCLDIYESYICVDGVPPDPPASYTVGDRTIEVFIPVPDGHPLMEGVTHDSSFDGVGCERVGVRAERDRDFLLAGIAGFDGAATTQGAVGRATFVGDVKEFASLIVLERRDCQVLVNAGNAELRVLNLVRWELADGTVVAPNTSGAEQVTYRGTITVDSLPPADGCSGNNTKIIQSAGTSTTDAQGDIFAHALQSADANNLYTYRASDVASGNLNPRPSPGPSITRALIDHQYNCITSAVGYDAGPTWSPAVGNQPIDPCPITQDAAGNDITPPPYLRYLHDEIDAAMGGADNWLEFPADVDEIDDCAGATGTVTGGRWIVRCPAGFGPGNIDLLFQDVDQIIFENGLEIGNNDRMRIYGDPTVGTAVTMYDGGLEADGGEVEMRHVFIYIRTAATNQSGKLEVTGSTDRFALQAPLTDAGCATYTGGLPPASCFSPLAVWSNYAGDGGGTRRNRVAGNAAGGLIGTLFTPNSNFRFAGSGDADVENCGAPSWDLISNTAATLELVGAQFFARSITLPSGAQVGMCPSPETTVGVPIRGSGLIR